MRAALQHRCWAHAAGARPRESDISTRQVFIQGVTAAGRTFRPSDWAERLAGALSCFRPAGQKVAPNARLGYSPLCVPRVIGGVKCVILSEALKDVEPMAWDFAMNFARDNDLQVVDACLMPESSAQPGAAEKPQEGAD